MSENPIGTVTDEERLVPLYRDDGFHVDVTDPVRTADVPAEGTYAWHLIEASDADRLAIAPVVDADEAGDLATAELSTTDEGCALAVPEGLLADGLEIDPADYDDDNPLLFEPEEITDGIAVGMTVEGDPGGTVESGIELRPVRYADGTPYRPEPLAGETLDSDPIAEAEMERRRGGDATPRLDAVSAPVDAPVLEDVLAESDAAQSDVVDALETMARQDLVGEGDDERDTGPMVLDDRAVVSLGEDNWAAKVAAELAADDATLAAVREAHARQTEAMLAETDAGPGEIAGVVPVVIQPDRHYESDEPPA